MKRNTGLKWIYTNLVSMSSFILIFKLKILQKTRKHLNWNMGTKWANKRMKYLNFFLTPSQKMCCRKPFVFAGDI